MQGIAEMKRGSGLLRRLDADLAPLRAVDCRSYYCRSDLTVVPGWEARLPVGPAVALPVWTRRQCITNARALKMLKKDLVRA